MISGFLVVRNEAHRIEKTIQYLRPFVDEIVVVDQDSDDDTKSIAEKFADLVRSDENRGLAEPSREYAESLTSGEWVVFLDADERIDSDDCDVLRNLAKRGDSDGFILRRLTVIGGTVMADEKKYRFYRRGCAKYYGTPHSDPTPTRGAVDCGLTILHEKTWAEQELDNEHYRRMGYNGDRNITHAEAMRGIHLDGEGSITQSEADYLSSLVRGQGKITVAETGFGLGWSAWAFLSANPDCDVVSFDVASHAGVYQAKAVIDRVFPGRHRLIVGDSKITVPDNMADYWLAYIDGGHDYETALADLKNFQKGGRHVVLDDMDDAEWTSGIRRAWAEMSEAVVETERHNDGVHVWVTGKYI